MAGGLEGMVIFPVTPQNYDKIIKRSEEGRPFKETYTIEELGRINTQATAKNVVAMIMFMDPSFWRNGHA